MADDDHALEVDDEDNDSPFPLGTVAWASLDGFPMWPARIVSKHQVAFERLKVRVIPQHKVIVLFFNDNDNFSLIEHSKVEIFNIADRASNRKRIRHREYGKELAEAARQADEFVRLHQPKMNIELAEKFKSKHGAATASASGQRSAKGNSSTGSGKRRGGSSRMGDRVGDRAEHHSRDRDEPDREPKPNPRKRRKPAHRDGEDDGDLEDVPGTMIVDRDNDERDGYVNHQQQQRPIGKTRKKNDPDSTKSSGVKGSRAYKRQKGNSNSKRARSANDSLKGLPPATGAVESVDIAVPDGKDGPGQRKKLSSSTTAATNMPSSSHPKKRGGAKATAMSSEEYDDGDIVDHNRHVGDHDDDVDDIRPRASSPLVHSLSRKKHRYPSSKSTAIANARHSHAEFSTDGDGKKRRGKQLDEQIAIPHSKKGRRGSGRRPKGANVRSTGLLSGNESELESSRQSLRSPSPRRRDDNEKGKDHRFLHVPQEPYANGGDDVVVDNENNIAIRSPVVLGVGNVSEPHHRNMDDSGGGRNQSSRRAAGHGGYSSSEEEYQAHRRYDDDVRKRSPVGPYDHDRPDTRPPPPPPNIASDGERTEDSSGNDEPRHHHHHPHHLDHHSDRDHVNDHDHDHSDGRAHDHHERDMEIDHGRDHDPSRDPRSFSHVDEDRPPPTAQTDDDGEDTIDDDDNDDVVQKGIVTHDTGTSQVEVKDVAILNPEEAETEDDDDDDINRGAAQLAPQAAEQPAMPEVDARSEQHHQNYYSDSGHSVASKEPHGVDKAVEKTGGMVLYHGLDCIPDDRYIRPYRDMPREDLIHLLILRDEELNRNALALWCQAVQLKKKEVLDNPDDILQRCQKAFGLAMELVDFVAKGEESDDEGGRVAESVQVKGSLLYNRVLKDKEDIVCSSAHRLSDILFSKEVNLKPILDDIIRTTRKVSAVSVRAAIAFRNIASLWMDVMKMWGKEDYNIPDLHDEDDSEDAGGAGGRNEDTRMETDSDHENENGQHAPESPPTPKGRKQFDGRAHHDTPSPRHPPASDDEMRDRPVRHRDDDDEEEVDRRTQRADEQRNQNLNQYDSYSDDERINDGGSGLMGERRDFQGDDDVRHEHNDHEIEERERDCRGRGRGGEERVDEDESIENREDRDAGVLKSVLEDEEARTNNEGRALDERIDHGEGSVEVRVGHDDNGGARRKAEDEMNAADGRIMSDREDGKSTATVNTKPVHGKINHIHKQEQEKTDEKLCTMNMKCDGESDNERTENPLENINRSNDVNDKNRDYDVDDRLGTRERDRKTSGRDWRGNSDDATGAGAGGDDSGDRGRGRGKESYHRERAGSPECRGSKDRRRGSSSRGRRRGRGHDGSRSRSRSPCSRGSGSHDKRRWGESRFADLQLRDGDESRSRDRSPRSEGRADGRGSYDGLGRRPGGAHRLYDGVGDRRPLLSSAPAPPPPATSASSALTPTVPPPSHPPLSGHGNNPDHNIDDRPSPFPRSMDQPSKPRLMNSDMNTDINTNMPTKKTNAVKVRRNSGSENESPNLQSDVKPQRIKERDITKGGRKRNSNDVSNGNGTGNGSIFKREKARGDGPSKFSNGVEKKPRMSSSSLGLFLGSKAKDKVENGGGGGPIKPTGERKKFLSGMKDICDIMQDGRKSRRKEIAHALEEACWSLSQHRMDNYTDIITNVQRTIQGHVRRQVRKDPDNGGGGLDAIHSRLAQAIKVALSDDCPHLKDVARQLVDLCMQAG